MRQSCSACSGDGHNRNGCPLMHGPKRPYLQPVRGRETKALHEDMQLCFDFHNPKTPSEVFTALRDQWGALGERRLQRILRRLETERAVVAVGIRRSSGGIRCGSDGYVRRAA